ncbi:hypothetical protein BDZ89DRAFT_506046 [Hymenopellis radicata]|nr:hypothetical protein BDZ89DRAFT_506046 [Hymenopellis radicata]
MFYSRTQSLLRQGHAQPDQLFGDTRASAQNSSKKAGKAGRSFGLAPGMTPKDVEEREAIVRAAGAAVVTRNQSVSKQTRRVANRDKTKDYRSGHLPRELTSVQMETAVELAQQPPSYLQDRIKTSSVAPAPSSSRPLPTATTTVPSSSLAVQTGEPPSSVASSSRSVPTSATTVEQPSSSSSVVPPLEDADLHDIGEYEDPSFLDDILPVGTRVNLLKVQETVDAIPGPSLLATTMIQGLPKRSKRGG